ncbi:hypothetical protein D5F01_LYC00501 [Larimichthys crocea]|uniref:Uncharacterized protein n=1 Tax=Larimichthys crocea TaxID=215358 RepID=A0A6G0J9Z2_LARCR|nr:hypothetical protein D5F01_LYC00501 [Larimichthys crocea]
MCVLRPLLLSVVIIICYFVTGPYNCVAAVKKTSCHVQDGRADCRHLSLSLIHLDVSYNSITKVDGGLCQTLPLLQTLNMEHNEIFVLKKEDVSHCTKLTRLIMASNRLKLQGEPFSALQSLEFLDVSINKLKSAKLGTQPQLPNLVNLNLASNDFTTLKKDDFSFLNHSTKSTSPQPVIGASKNIGAWLL